MQRSSIPSLARHISSSALRAAAALVLVAGATASHAEADEAQARAAMSDLQVYVSEASAVITELQPDINAGRLSPEKAAVDALMAAFSSRYAKTAGRPFDDKGDGLDAQARRAFREALRGTLARYQPTMVKGGEDAFVPAFFRAQALKGFNARMEGRMQAYAINRDKDLINGDWSVDRMMKGSPWASSVAAWMQGGGLAPVVKRSGDRLLGYWPMKLQAACVACHAKSGLRQREGGFGGALVVEVTIGK